MRKFLVGALSVLLALFAHGQEFRPYPQPRVTVEQWKAYFDEVSAKYAASARIAPNQPLVVFDDGKNAQYAFTQPGHPAHPSWVARKVIETEKGLSLALSGYFAGDERAFAALFSAYAASTQNLRDHVKREGEKKSP